MTGLCTIFIVYSFVLRMKEIERQKENEKKNSERAYKINTKTKSAHVNNDDFLVIIKIKFINKFKMTKDIFLIFSGNKLKVV